MGGTAHAGPCRGSARQGSVPGPLRPAAGKVPPLEQCRGLDKAVVQLTELCSRTQVSAQRPAGRAEAWWVAEQALGQGG